MEITALRQRAETKRDTILIDAACVLNSPNPGHAYACDGINNSASLGGNRMLFQVNTIILRQ